MKSNFGESMIWLAAVEGGGDGSPHAAKATGRGDALTRADAQNFARPAKTEFSPVFRLYFSYCRTINNQGKA
ncbi:hypothetical protein [Rhizobium aouanii]|uniref:Uncharacterized protein n=1 Tax=Rhizobium aouanii TaxID=3118145 RepID=A0ABU8CQF5_9HYPH